MRFSVSFRSTGLRRSGAGGVGVGGGLDLDAAAQAQRAHHGHAVGADEVDRRQRVHERDERHEQREVGGARVAEVEQHLRDVEERRAHQRDERSDRLKWAECDGRQ